MVSRLPITYELEVDNIHGGIQYPFDIDERLVFLTNDSSEYDIQINFDKTIGQSGTFTLKSGEILNDVPMSCYQISFQAVTTNPSIKVPIRVMGV